MYIEQHIDRLNINSYYKKYMYMIVDIFFIILLHIVLIALFYTMIVICGNNIVTALSNYINYGDIILITSYILLYPILLYITFIVILLIIYIFFHLYDLYNYQVYTDIPLGAIDLNRNNLMYDEIDLNRNNMTYGVIDLNRNHVMYGAI